MTSGKGLKVTVLCFRTYLRTTTCPINVRPFDWSVTKELFVFQHTMPWSPQPFLRHTQTLLFHRKLGQRNQKQSVRTWTLQTLKQYLQVCSLDLSTDFMTWAIRESVLTNCFFIYRSPKDWSHRGSSLCWLHWSYQDFHQCKKILNESDIVNALCSGLSDIGLEVGSPSGVHMVIALRQQTVCSFLRTGNL